jgi:hypothetical protein
MIYPANYNAAEKYVKLGLSVIPLTPNNKLPLIEWKEYTQRKTKETDFAEWFITDETKNIGIVTGNISGITVVDFDLKNGLSDKFKLFPPTKTVKTPSGGFHLYYRYNPIMKTTADVFKDGSGVDIRNDGGYVVAPPSTINGESYKVINGADFAEFPIHLFQDIQQGPKQSGPLVGVTEGSRNQTMARMVGKLLKITPRDKWDTELYAEIQLINQSNKPPLPEYELQTIFNSIKNRELLSISKKDDGQSNEVREYLATIETKDLENLDDAKAKSAFLSGLAQYSGDDEIISTKEIVEQIKLEGAIEKFYTGWSGLDSLLGGFSPGQLVVLSAPTKNGKTTFGMALTQNMSKYSPTWFPFEESAHELVNKFLERGQEPPLFYVPKALVDNKLDWIEKRIIESLLKHKSRIFIIDQLDWLTNEKQFLGPEINNIMKGLKRIAKTWGIVIIVMAHITKLDPEIPPTMNDLRDSGNIANKCDTLIMMWRDVKREAKVLKVSNNTFISVQLNRRTGKTGVLKFGYENGKYLEDGWTIEIKTDTEGRF